VCICVFLFRFRYGTSAARAVSGPQKMKHRYTQIYTDKHRWDNAVAAARVLTMFGVGSGVGSVGIERVGHG
jgi:hypothetical protein